MTRTQPSRVRTSPRLPRPPGPARAAAALLALRTRRGARIAAAGVTAAAVTAGLLYAGSHDVYPRTRVPLESGQAWVRSDRIGALTLLDGVAGQTVTNVRVARHSQDALQAAQSGSTGFALDRTAGAVTRIDGASLTAYGDPLPLGGTGRQIELFAGNRRLYAVDGTTSQVTVYDAATLHRQGPPRAFATGSTDFTAVVDARDRLWVLDRGTGDLTRFDGTARHQRDQAFAPGTTTLTLVEGSPVATDGSTGTAYRLGADGATRARLRLGLTAGDGIQVSGATGQDAVLLTAGTRGTYATCAFARGRCDTPVRVGFGDDSLGPAVAADGRVFVPDYTTGDAWIVDPTGATAARQVTLLGQAAHFDLFARDGLVFFNDPGSSRAGTVAADGRVHGIAKYQQSAPVPAPSTGPAATAPPHTASVTATPPPGGAGLPPGAAASATGPPHPTGDTGPAATATGPDPSGRPLPTGSPTATGPAGPPTPSPTPSRPGTVTCGQTLTRSVVLTGDLHCHGDALVIGADRITVDLGGHTVSGDGTGTGITLRESRVPVAGAVVQHGTVAHFATGLAVGPSGATGLTVDMADFEEDGTGDGTAAVDLGHATVDGLRITQVTAVQSGGRFFHSEGTMSGDLLVTGSTVRGGSFDFTEQPDVTVHLALTDDSFDHAPIGLANVEDSTITDSAFASSPVTDMCDHSGGDTIRDNRFSGPVYGITIEDMAGETISGNHFSGNLVGVFLAIGDGDGGNTVTGNTFTGDTVAGIWLQYRGSTPQAVHITDNTATANGTSPGDTVDSGGNPVQGGIHLYAPAGGIVATGNRTSGNSGYGIWSLPGTVTGSGNISSGDEKNCAPADLCGYR